MMSEFNFKCPICDKTVRNTDVIRTTFGGRMCMHCYLKTQDGNANIKRREYERV
jgi:hypothetical protein